ncbi:hypothetical protein [Pelagicoccus sp. SDUM812003]|uniref:hypothetical protein n=1 Tax=Pelagicoccus sp. SDUM812003 TaxID=3041267 RepID=UPI00280F8D68|nr:hypothetical protein [Pelagicoccus sp. SDUM812003]MDQ8203330.1 hypothetical protein [Pelagicoccus sp. SDUM812003]
MINDTLKQIADAKAKLANLEKKAATEQAKKLRDLHKSLGFDSRAELIAALSELEGGKVKRGRKAKAPAAKGAKKRAKRTRITEELKAEVIAAVQAGEKGTDVAKRFGISVPSLQNIKKAAGLTKSRK